MATLIAIPVMVLTFFVVVAALKPDGESNPVESLAAPQSDSPDCAKLVAALPERYRAVVMLYYLEDVSYPEIAEILDLPLGTVKTHLHRAKRLLREHLHGWGDPAPSEADLDA